jgi:excinuclease ABC subunit A
MQIQLKKVKVHNLKEIDLTLDPFQLIVFTGVSGSGKSSLAFDTIFVEGQRRYVESLPHSAQRFLSNLPKPDAKLIEGISPTLAIEQKSISKNPRSTIGTITGTYDYIRILFAKIGIPHCPISNEIVTPQSKEQIIQEIKNQYVDKKIILLSPFAENKKATFAEEFKELLRKGFLRVRIDGEIKELTEVVSLDEKQSHTIEIIIDRLILNKNNFNRLVEAVELALEIGLGFFYILDIDSKEEKVFSKYAYSAKSNMSYPPLAPNNFSFNHPLGMCDYCQGLGEVYEFDIDKIIDPELSIAQDCCKIASSYNTVYYGNVYNNLSRIYKFNINTPWKDLSNTAKEVFLYGIDKKWTVMNFVHPKKKKRWKEYVHFNGVINEAHKRLKQSQSDVYKKNMHQLMKHMICPKCKGHRLKSYPAATTLCNYTIFDVTNLTISNAFDFFKNIKLNKDNKKISEEPIKEILKRLEFLKNVGLDYLSLDRPSPSLSGGESQRVRLAAQIGSGLIGTIYILDEPSIGLHPVDQGKLIETLKNIVKSGNTVIVVEHDKETMKAADTIVDIGPYGGYKGGKIVAQGDYQSIINNPDSLTGKYLCNKLTIPALEIKNKSSKSLKIINASHNNLKNVNLKIPLNGLVCITGVSGSGKSSLVSDTLYPYLSNKLQNSNLPCGKIDNVEGVNNINKIIFVDQSPIGRTPRSNPSTYIKLLDEIRLLFSSLQESKARGYAPTHFSFNTKEGSCPYCKGMGQIKIDMDFLENAYVTCMQCKGKRFSNDILSITYKDLSIYDVLNLEVSEAIEIFEAIPKIYKKLKLLQDVGLEYLHLGQSSTTLSGGEAQRIKLAKEISRPSANNTLYILDEPTTGLHFHDIKKLLEIISKLIANSNTVLAVEHNLDFIKAATHIIELGPQAADKGGKVIAEGTLDAITKKDTPTGRALKEFLLNKDGNKKQKKTPKASFEDMKIVNAKQNNLKNLNVTIPHNQISVFTGPSGSGKSSLAFDTIFAEGQRRYIDALPSFTKQLLIKMPKPSIDKIENLTPTIAIEQKGHHTNPRSTVGTLTEVYDLLRLIFTHLGVAYCPETKEKIQTISKEFICNKIIQSEKDNKIQVLTPIQVYKGENFSDLLQRLNRQGFLRIRLNGTYYEIDEDIPYNKSIKNEIFLVIDRLVIKDSIYQRFLEAINLACKISNGIVIIAAEKDYYYNLAFAVESTGKSYPPITYKTFSFNSEQGMCLTCQGLGYVYGTNFGLEIERFSISRILQKVLKKKNSTDSQKLLALIFEKNNIDISIPIKNLTKEEKKLFFEGGIKAKIKNSTLIWKGLNFPLEFAAKHAKFFIKRPLIGHMNEKECPSCKGSRLNPLARNVTINDQSIVDICSYPIKRALDFIQDLTIPLDKKNLLKEPLNQLVSRLTFLCEIGLSYISLNRSAPTLSGGELQRIYLSRQLGCGLSNVTYILDEPTIGLHPFNNHLLNEALKNLKEKNNTLILVEHDPQTISIADNIYDFGPKAGIAGGEIVAHGSLSEIKENPASLTGLYLSHKKSLYIPKKRRTSTETISIKNASLHNLKNIKADFKVGVINCVTGISGSGKSTLVNWILKPAISQALSSRKKQSSIHIDSTEICNVDLFDKIIAIDQKPIKQTSRSDVSSYSDVLTPIRSFFSSLKEAKAKGLKPRYFSSNHKKGMCQTCQGLGCKIIDLQYLSPVKLTCESCLGFRLNPLSLSVKYKDKHLGEILDLTVKEANDFFENIPFIARKLQTLISVGLEYLKLNQELSSLSGGEQQRIRLAKELSKRSTGKTLYIFDEPTIGLHDDDIEKLLKIFHTLADKKNTLIIIEHNLGMIANADHIIDMGPDAGEYGGEIIFSGTVQDLLKFPKSKISKYLKEYLQK